MANTAGSRATHAQQDTSTTTHVYESYIVPLAASRARLDGVGKKFLECRDDPEAEMALGHYEYYTSEAKVLLVESGIAEHLEMYRHTAERAVKALEASNGEFGRQLVSVRSMKDAISGYRHLFIGSCLLNAVLIYLLSV